MKYQARHDLIDPEAPRPKMGFEFEDNDVPDPPDDAYVIGADGSSIRKPDFEAATESQEGPNRWAKPAAFVLVALFVVLTLWNAVRLIQGPPPPPKPSPFQAKQALYLGVMKIDAYHRVHGVVPDSLAEAGLPEADAYAYRRVDPAHYVLSFQGGGSKLEYDSSEPKERFFGSPKDMLTMGDSR
jgi:hypothetical protein